MRSAQHCRAAQTVSDQKVDGMPPRFQGGRCGDHIVHVAGERGILEFALGMAEAGEVEPQHSDAQSGQTGGNASSRRDVLAASETMHHQRCGQWGSVGQIQTSAKVTAVMAFEGESFGPHARSSGVAAKMTMHPRPDNRLATCVTGV